MSRITLWGFYQFTDKHLFDDVVLPEGIDKQRLIDLIMMESGDLYAYYQQPTFLKMQIDNFFARKYDDFARMYAALYADYNPIENYDRKEDWTDNFNESVSGTATDETHDGSESSSTGKVSAMDSDDFVNDTYAESSTSGNSNATTTNEAQRENEANHDGRIHGNIGVTTSQQMIESELKLREYDIYLRIAKMFEKQIVVQVY